MPARRTQAKGEEKKGKTRSSHFPAPTGTVSRWQNPTPSPLTTLPNTRRSPQKWSNRNATWKRNFRVRTPKPTVSTATRTGDEWTSVRFRGDCQERTAPPLSLAPVTRGPKRYGQLNNDALAGRCTRARARLGLGQTGGRTRLNART